MAKHSPPLGDHPSRHPLSHHSDHSGAHVRGTHHHEHHAHDPYDGLEAEMAGDGKGRESGDSELHSGEKYPEPRAGKHISEHPSGLVGVQDAMSHNRGKQE